MIRYKYYYIHDLLENVYKIYELYVINATKSQNKRINYFIYSVNKLYDIGIDGLKCSISFHFK